MSTVPPKSPPNRMVKRGDADVKPPSAPGSVPGKPAQWSERDVPGRGDENTAVSHATVSSDRLVPPHPYVRGRNGLDNAIRATRPINHEGTDASGKSGPVSRDDFPKGGSGNPPGGAR